MFVLFALTPGPQHSMLYTGGTKCRLEGRKEGERKGVRKRRREGRRVDQKGEGRKSRI